MKKLLKRLNKFYKKYDITNFDEKVKLYPEYMYDLDYLMSAYESIWFSLEAYEDSTACKFMAELYRDLHDYMFDLQNGLIKRPKYDGATILKIIVSVFGTMCLGAFVAIGIECGYLDWYIGCGMAFSSLLAFASGMGAYEDIKWVKNND